jgi:hypothetical protein
VQEPCGTISKTEDLFSFAGGSGQITVTRSPDCPFYGTLWQPSWNVGPDGKPWFRYVDGPTATLSDGRVVNSWTYTVDSTTYGRSGQIKMGDRVITISQRRTTATFNDVRPSSDSFDAVNLMAQRHITLGCSGQPPL